MSQSIGDWWNSEEMRQSRPAIILIIAFFVLVFFYKHGLDVISKSDDDYTLNVHTEVFGFGLALLFTVYVIDNLNRRRDDQRRKQELIDRLLREARSPEAVIARHALHEIRDRHMLKGEKCILRGKRLSHVQWENASLEFSDLCGSSLGKANLKGATFLFALLNGAHFSYAKLQKADLTAAKINHADLVFANLEGANMSFTEIIDSMLMESLLDDANLYRANLKGSSLASSRMAGANLCEANLSNTKLMNVQLDNADLSNASLSGANLENASLTGAILDGTQFDSNTILPDKKKWNPRTDLARFTDTAHMCYWRSDHELSPAYSGTLDKRFTSKELWEFNFPYPNIYHDLDES